MKLAGCLFNSVLGNIEGAIDMTYWIRIHLAYQGKSVSKSKLSFKRHIQNKCIEMVGICVTLGIMIMISKIILCWL